MIDPKAYNKPVPKLWFRVLIMVHGLTGISAITAAIQDKPWILAGIMGVGYITDMIIRFIKQDNPELEDASKN